MSRKNEPKAKPQRLLNVAAIEQFAAFLPFVHFLDLGPLFVGGYESDGWKASFMERPTGEKVFVGAFGDDYRPVQHDTVFLGALKNLQDRGLTDISADVYLTHEGARMKATFIVGSVLIGGLNPTITVWNSADGSYPVKVGAGTYRQVCGNGAAIGKIFAVMSKKHTVGALPQVEAAIREMVGTTMSSLEAYLPDYQAKIELAKKTVVHNLEAKFQGLGFGARTASILVNAAQEDEGDAKYSLGEETNAWVVYNALTRHATRLERGDRESTDRQSVDAADRYRQVADTYLEGLTPIAV